MPNDSKVIIDASKSINICHDVIEIIDEFKTSADYRNIEVEIREREKKGIRNQRKAVEFALSEV